MTIENVGFPWNFLYLVQLKLLSRNIIHLSSIHNQKWTNSKKIELLMMVSPKLTFLSAIFNALSLL